MGYTAVESAEFVYVCGVPQAVVLTLLNHLLTAGVPMPAAIIWDQTTFVVGGVLQSPCILKFEGVTGQAVQLALDAFAG